MFLANFSTIDLIAASIATASPRDPSRVGRADCVDAETRFITGDLHESEEIPAPFPHLRPYADPVRTPRLSQHLSGKVELYAKREDCNSGLAFGGNKTRKLEYLIPEALAQGCDTLVSIGGIQSNQTRQVAAVAAHLGMKCVLVQENWVNYSDAVYDRVNGNIQDVAHHGCGRASRGRRTSISRLSQEVWEDALESVREAGGKPYAIPGRLLGDHPLGGLGFGGLCAKRSRRQQEAELGLQVRLYAYRVLGDLGAARASVVAWSATPAGTGHAPTVQDRHRCFSQACANARPDLPDCETG